jgi:dolichol-phosphate mannosyltransferase
LRALICIPTYNEIDNVQPIVESALAHTASLGGGTSSTGELDVSPAGELDTVDVLVIDDNSPDGTGKKADELAQRHAPRVHVLHRPGKMGLGQAYVGGFRWGLERGYDALIEMDADFSHDPKYLPEMMRRLRTHDVVIGSRYVPGGGTVNWGIGRKVISRGGSLYSRLILGAGIRDFTGGFNGWRRGALEAVDIGSLRSDGYSFQIELKYRAHRKGFKITEFPIVFEDRKVGKSKMSKKIVFEALGRVWGFRFKAAR